MSFEFKRDKARGALDIMRFSSEKWYPLMLIMKDPARFVNLWDTHCETPLQMVGRKAYNFFAIAKHDGVGTYVRNLKGAMYIPNSRLAAKKICSFAKDPSKLDYYRNNLATAPDKLYNAEASADLIWQRVCELGVEEE